MYHFHLRDVSEIGPHGLDVPLGAGQGRMSELFQLLADREVKPLMMMEYEHDFDNPMPYLIESVNYINRLCGKIIEEQRQKAQMGTPIRLNASAAQFRPICVWKERIRRKLPFMDGTVQISGFRGIHNLNPVIIRCLFVMLNPMLLVL